MMDRSRTQEWPKCDAAKAAGIAEKKIAKCLKEGGKKGVEIEGAADMSGLTCFCTRMTEAGDSVELLEVSMEGMNAIPDPARTRKSVRAARGTSRSSSSDTTTRRIRSPWSRTSRNR